MRIHITITDEKGNQYEGNAILEKAIKQKGKTVVSKQHSKPKPSGAVHTLYIDNFFKEEKKLSDVTKALSKQGYNFNKDSVYRALQNADFLNVKGAKGSYRFLQKFPPSRN